VLRSALHEKKSACVVDEALAQLETLSNAFLQTRARSQCSAEESSKALQEDAAKLFGFFTLLYVARHCRADGDLWGHEEFPQDSIASPWLNIFLPTERFGTLTSVAKFRATFGFAEALAMLQRWRFSPPPEATWVQPAETLPALAADSSFSW
jgi:hypothetical protein